MAKHVTDELYSSDEEQEETIKDIAKKRNQKRAPFGVPFAEQSSDKAEYQKFLSDSIFTIPVQNNKASYILSEISNRLLYSEEVTRIYNKVKDPLELEKQNLTSLIQSNSDANLGIKQAFTECTDIESCKAKALQYSITAAQIDEQPITEAEVVQEYKKRVLEITAVHPQLEKIQAALDAVDCITVENYIEKIASIPEIQNAAVIFNQPKLQNIEVDLRLAHYKQGAIKCVQGRLKYDKKAQQADRALVEVTALQKMRDELAIDLKGTFPFVPRMPPKTFAKEYPKELLPHIPDKAKVARQLAEYRYKLKIKDAFFITPENNQLKALCKLFNIEIKRTIGGKVKQEVLTDLLSKIEGIIGRYPEDHEIKEYMRLTKQQDKDMGKVAEEVHKKVQDKLADLYAYIDRKNLLALDIATGISRTYKDILRDQQDAIAKLDIPNPDAPEQNKKNFLAQVRADRKFNRVAYKDAVIEDNSEGTFNLPPGRDTTNTFYSSGSMSQFVGTLSTYREIGSNPHKAPTEFKETIIKDQPRSNSISKFRNLFQVEAIRSTSALLTNAMFFDLVEKKTLKIEDLADKMPMAMKEAVPAAVFLEHSLRDQQSSRMVYDYRGEGKELPAKILAAKNNNILYQWLVEIKLEKNDIPITKINDNIRKENATIQDITDQAGGEYKIQYFKEGQAVAVNDSTTTIAEIARIEIEYKGYFIELNPKKIIVAHQWQSEIKFGQDYKVDINEIKATIKAKADSKIDDFKNVEVIKVTTDVGCIVKYTNKEGIEIADTANTEIKDVYKIILEKNGESIELAIAEIITSEPKISKILSIEITPEAVTWLKDNGLGKTTTLLIDAEGQTSSSAAQDINKRGIDSKTIIIFDQAAIKELIKPANVRSIREMYNVENDPNKVITTYTTGTGEKKVSNNITLNDLRQGINLKHINAKQFYNDIQANADPDSGHENLEFLKGHRNLLGLTIKQFPSAVFNELTKEWYGVELPYLEKDAPLSIGDLRLKADAAPRDPGHNPRDDANDPVKSGERSSQDELVPLSGDEKYRNSSKEKQCHAVQPEIVSLYTSQSSVQTLQDSNDDSKVDVEKALELRLKNIEIEKARLINPNYSFNEVNPSNFVTDLVTRISAINLTTEYSIETAEQVTMPKHDSHGLEVIKNMIVVADEATTIDSVKTLSTNLVLYSDTSDETGSQKEKVINSSLRKSSDEAKENSDTTEVVKEIKMESSYEVSNDANSVQTDIKPESSEVLMEGAWKQSTKQSNTEVLVIAQGKRVIDESQPSGIGQYLLKMSMDEEWEKVQKANAKDMATEQIDQVWEATHNSHANELDQWLAMTKQEEEDSQAELESMDAVWSQTKVYTAGSVQKLPKITDPKVVKEASILTAQSSDRPIEQLPAELKKSQSHIGQQTQVAPSYEAPKVLTGMGEILWKSTVQCLRMAIYVDRYDLSDVLHSPLFADGCSAPTRASHYSLSPELRETLSQNQSTNRYDATKQPALLSFSNLLDEAQSDGKGNADRFELKPLDNTLSDIPLSAFCSMVGGNTNDGSWAQQFETKEVDLSGKDGVS